MGDDVMIRVEKSTAVKVRLVKSRRPWSCGGRQYRVARTLFPSRKVFCCPSGGIRYKFHPTRYSALSSDAALLILCVETRCLIVELLHSYPLPESITEFLSDQNVIFVGTGIRDDTEFRTLLEWMLRKGCETAVELGHFAAKLLKKPSLDGYSLVRLANEVGLSFEKQRRECGTSVDWSARNRSRKQIKLAIHNAYASYQIAAKLLKLLSKA